MFAPEQISGAKLLLAELGIFRTMKVGWRIMLRERRGEPFAELGPPETEDDRLSREQIGPAILLYSELREIVDGDEAYRITEQAVIEGAVAFLSRMIGSIRRTEIAALNEDERQRYVKERGAKFFNATVDWNEVSSDRVKFTVTHCKFPPLCAAAGFPELAPIFCKGDAKFFGTIEEDVELIRPHTIAEGAETCPFTIQFKEDGAP